MVMSNQLTIVLVVILAVIEIAVFGVNAVVVVRFIKPIGSCMGITLGRPIVGYNAAAILCVDMHSVVPEVWFCADHI
jgi:hypothetical protein